jgi:deoxyribodipyrimidine photo-lyase
MASQRLVLWFRNDLRLHDNYVIAEAAKMMSSNRKLEVGCQNVACRIPATSARALVLILLAHVPLPWQIVPVYCFDPRHFGTSQYGPRKCGVLRAKFLQESVLDLKTSLKGIGSDLLVYHGTPESIMPTLMSKDAATTVLAHEETCDEELRVDRGVRRAIKQLKGDLKLIWGSTLFHKDDLPYNQDLANMPDVFTPFKEGCEKKSRGVRLCAPTPRTLPPLPADLLEKAKDSVPPLDALDFSADDVARARKSDPRSVLAFQGGETAALGELCM